jgi:hypothetical protein
MKFEGRGYKVEGRSSNILQPWSEQIDLATVDCHSKGLSKKYTKLRIQTGTTSWEKNETFRFNHALLTKNRHEQTSNLHMKLIV